MDLSWMQGVKWMQNHTDMLFILVVAILTFIIGISSEDWTISTAISGVMLSLFAIYKQRKQGPLIEFQNEFQVELIDEYLKRTKQDPDQIHNNYSKDPKNLIISYGYVFNRGDDNSAIEILDVVLKAQKNEISPIFVGVFDSLNHSNIFHHKARGDKINAKETILITMVFNKFKEYNTITDMDIIIFYSIVNKSTNLEYKHIQVKCKKLKG